MSEHQDPQNSASPPVTSLARAQSRHLRAHAPSRAHASPIESSINIKPAYLWWVFCQWWMILIPVGVVLSFASAAAIILLYKPDYKASALIMIEESAPYIAFSQEAAEGGTARYVETQIELLRSPVVLELLLAVPEVANYPEVAKSADRVAHLQKYLGISRIGASELYNVSYISKSPKHAAFVANAVIQKYLDIQSRGEYERFQRVIDLLEEERRQRSLDVERLRQKVVALAKEVTGRDPFGYGSTLDVTRTNSPFATTYMELTQVDVEREVLKAQIQSYKELEAAGDDYKDATKLLDLEVQNDAAVRELEASIDAWEHKAEGYASKMAAQWDPKSDADYQRIQREVELQQNALKKLKTSLREELSSERKDRESLERKESLLRMDRELAALETRRQLLSKRFEEELAGIQGGNSKSVELTFAEAELEREEKVFELIAARKLAMQTESRAPARVSIEQTAAVPGLPITKLPLKMLIMACVLCVAAPFGLAVLREASVLRITNVEQLSRETSVRIIGEVAHFPIRRAAANGQTLPPKLQRQMFVYLESIDSLRTNLSLAQPTLNSRVLVVTSAAAAEGKTCLATSLAVSIGNAEKRPVLVIDGDMRSPDVATVLGAQDRPGLAELLMNRATLSDVIQRIGKTNTYVIAAGRLKGNPHHVVREERLTDILSQLRGKFSSIIVDTPPIFGGSESLVFAKLADSVIVSVMRDVSRSKQLRNAFERLEDAGATVAGTVLNGTSSNGYATNYGYGYYSEHLEAPQA